LTFAFILWYNLQTKFLKNFIVIASLAFFVFQVLYTFTQNLTRLDSVPIGIETILVFIYIAFFFYENLKTPTTTYFYSHHCFWISVGILIYLGGSLFFYILIDQLDEDEIHLFGTMTYIADIIKNILFGVAIVMFSKESVRKFQNKDSIPFLDMI
jgi:hypothetical protein